MFMHPALLMATVWIACTTLYIILPFELIHRQISITGAFTLIVFINTFCFGSALFEFGNKNKNKHASTYTVSFKFADLVLYTATMCAVISLAINLKNNYHLDLTSAYQARSDAAQALLHGEPSTSGIAFQIGFLTYPAGYIVLARQIIFQPKIQLLPLIFFGALPILMATLSMGGRFPLLYAICIVLLSFYTRHTLIKRNAISTQHKISLYRKIFFAVIGIFSLCGALYYFAAVFTTRANQAGGTEAMFYVAENLWGIGFGGSGSDFLFSILGDDLSYLIFVFSWYITQGGIMATTIFTNYEGDSQLGVYGIDLVAAVARRVDGNLVANNFDSLMNINTYGFFPSAFGSLYVDFSYFGFLICLCWGAIAGIVYRKTKYHSNSRWQLVSPFITIGILFSQINTPLGFANGFVTHLWLALAFLCIYTTRQKLLSKKH